MRNGLFGASLGIFSAISALVAASPIAAQPAPPTLRFAFEEIVDIGQDEPAGQSAKGGRNRIALLGGAVQGPRLSGTLMAGGADWQLLRSDGCAEILADYFIKASDGAIIHVVNQGLACAPQRDRGLYLRANPVFEAPNGPHDWLNRSVFTSTIEELPARADKPRQVRIRFYEVE